MKYSIAIMAGGQSKRFGSDKTLFKLDNKYLIEYVVDECKKYSDDLFIVSKNTEKFKNILKIPVFEDEFEIQCPLSGIVTAFDRAKCDCCVILPADSPYFNGIICDILFDNLYDFDIAMPKFNNKTYALTAIYKTKLKEYFENCLLQGDYKIIKIINELKVNYLSEKYFKKIDKDLNSFLNINTKEDLEKLIRLINEF